MVFYLSTNEIKSNYVSNNINIMMFHWLNPLHIPVWTCSLFLTWCDVKVKCLNTSHIRKDATARDEHCYFFVNFFHSPHINIFGYPRNNLCYIGSLSKVRWTWLRAIMMAYSINHMIIHSTRCIFSASYFSRFLHHMPSLVSRIIYLIWCRVHKNVPAIKRSQKCEFVLWQATDWPSSR